jgi:hypothetical protein
MHAVAVHAARTPLAKLFECVDSGDVLLSCASPAAGRAGSSTLVRDGRRQAVGWRRGSMGGLIVAVQRGGGDRGRRPSASSCREVKRISKFLTDLTPTEVQIGIVVGQRVLLVATRPGTQDR